MIRYLIYSVLLLFSCVQENERTSQKSIEYKLISSIDSGEQYLTIIDSIVFYHGETSTISIDSSETSSIYFLSQAINSSTDQNGTDNMMFYDFQYSDELLNLSDFDSSKFNDRNELRSLDIYNSMWGELKGDTIILRATKHIYNNRSDEIKFIKR